MLGVTVFGLFFTPVFYVVIRGLVERRAAARAPDAAHEVPPVQVTAALVKRPASRSATLEVIGEILQAVERAREAQFELRFSRATRRSV